MSTTRRPSPPRSTEIRRSPAGSTRFPSLTGSTKRTHTSRRAGEAGEEGTGASFAVADPADGRLLGSLGLRLADLPDGVAEAGYWVAREARGRGVATHALRLAARWILEQGEVERLQLRADALNVPSQRVAEKAGFTREGVLRSLHYNPRLGRRVDFVMFSLLRSELP